MSDGTVFSSDPDVGRAGLQRADPQVLQAVRGRGDTRLAGPAAAGRALQGRRGAPVRHKQLPPVPHTDEAARTQS